MKFYKRLTAILLTLGMVSGTFPAVTVPAANPAVRSVLEEDDRQILNFNTNWLFVDEDDDNAKEINYDESEAEAVSLPHSLGEYDIFNPDPAQWQKVTWYRRHFTVSESEEGNRCK